jgi:putative ubiquitin-RnfH superfamily antitoxin RatB of RatAB toxin-antitoxin module
MNVVLVYSAGPRQVHEAAVQVAEGSTLAQALEGAGWLEAYPLIRQGGLALGVWGRKATPDTVLREGDRVELYRGLRVDPKVARRERFVGQGARGAGLFKQRRPGSKAGY